jgi:hypothetical protein
MPGGDTLTRVQVRVPTVREHLADVLLRAVCSRRGHRWQPYGRELPFGKREWCGCCESNRITLSDGAMVEASKVQVIACHPPFAEALYEARWGEPPRRALVTGDWPAL